MIIPYAYLQAQIAKTLITVHGVSPKEVAAITPYSAQREEIRKQLQTQAVSDVLVKTITESQGSIDFVKWQLHNINIILHAINCGD